MKLGSGVVKPAGHAKFKGMKNKRRTKVQKIRRDKEAAEREAAERLAEKQERYSGMNDDWNDYNA